MRILVIDDETFILDAITKILEAEKFEVLTASDRLTAVNTIKQRNDIDMVITDIMLPFSGGFDIVELIKEDPTKKHIPVIVITGMDEDVLNTTLTPADACLTKPFTSAQLLELVKKNMKTEKASV
jgi:two-component system cell cycle response regulator